MTDLASTLARLQGMAEEVKTRNSQRRVNMLHHTEPLADAVLALVEAARSPHQARPAARRLSRRRQDDVTDQHLHDQRDAMLQLAQVCRQLADAHEKLGHLSDAALLREVADHDDEAAQRVRVQIEQIAWIRAKPRLAGRP